MKVGDVVALKVHSSDSRKRTGVVVDIIQKKCWRTTQRGRHVDWSKVDPEPHATMMFENKLLTLPVLDLDVIND